MRLNQWLDENGLTDIDFARRAGVTREAVRLWRMGKRVPGRTYIHIIERLTLGRVRKRDLELANADTKNGKAPISNGSMDALRTRKRRLPRADQS